MKTPTIWKREKKIAEMLVPLKKSLKQLSSVLLCLGLMTEM